MLSILDRPYMLSEIATAFDVPVRRIESVVRRYRIDPACWVGRTRLYGPPQIRRIYTAISEAA